MVVTMVVAMVAAEVVVVQDSAKRMQQAQMTETIKCGSGVAAHGVGRRSGSEARLLHVASTLLDCPGGGSADCCCTPTAGSTVLRAGASSITPCLSAEQGSAQVLIVCGETKAQRILADLGTHPGSGEGWGTGRAATEWQCAGTRICGLCCTRAVCSGCLLAVCAGLVAESGGGAACTGAAGTGSFISISGEQSGEGGTCSAAPVCATAHAQAPERCKPLPGLPHTLQQHALCTPASAEGCSSSTPSMPGVASPCLRWRLSFATAFITVAVVASVCMLEECLVLCECGGTRGRRADDVESASSRASCEERGCTDD